MNHRRKSIGWVTAAMLTIAVQSVAPAVADEVKLAVAANFQLAATALSDEFARTRAHTVAISSGSTGQLYTQITQGAPFDIFLAADQTRPKRLAKDGHGVAASIFTYAIGRIVLYSEVADDKVSDKLVHAPDVNKFAIANPQTAPYGMASVEALRALGLYDQLSPKIVYGNNIAQTFQFVATENAELGLVALSQVFDKPGGSYWLVPSRYHSPIAQDAVLLSQAADNSVAREFINFLNQPAAKDIIEAFGYGVGR